jgi:hypothetical protein
LHQKVCKLIRSFDLVDSGQGQTDDDHELMLEP